MVLERPGLALAPVFRCVYGRMDIMADIFPPDYNTPTGQVRALIADVSEPYTLTDDIIGSLLAIYNDNAKRAAAQAYRTIAGSTVLLLKYIKTDDLLVDGTKVSAELRQLADDLDESANADDLADEEFFMLTYPKDCGQCLEYLERPTIKPWSGGCTCL